MPRPPISGPGAEPGEDLHALSSQAQEQSRLVLADLCDGVANLYKEVLPCDEAKAKHLDELGRWRLGGAFVSFGGVHDVHGVVNLDQDVNNRINPRPLDPAHTNELLQEFSSPGKKLDHESPIYLLCDPKILDESLVKRMEEVNIRDLTSSVPRFDVDRSQAEREHELEHNITWKFDKCTHRPFSQDELNVMIGELNNLRDRPRAQLLNGNHRMQAMVLLAQRVTPTRTSITEAVIKHGRLAEDEVRLQMEEIRKVTAQLTYRVEVYSIDTPTHLLTYLCENSIKRPTLPAGRGEQLWTEASRLDAIINVSMAKGSQDGLTRASSVNQVVKDWVQQNENPILGGILDSEIDTTVGERKKVRKSVPGNRHDEPKSGSPGSVVPPKSDIMYYMTRHASTLEMAISCWQACFVWDKVIKPNHAKSMATERGASLAARVWLGIQTLLKIMDVTSTQKLNDAERFIASVSLDALSSEGVPEASEHWEALHPMASWDSPRFLDYYDEAAVGKFAALVSEEKAHSRNSEGVVDYMKPASILPVRCVFIRFGEYFDDPRDENKRLVAASCRLYGLLPLHTHGGTQSHFFPAALLPTPQWISSMDQEVTGSKDKSLVRACEESIWVLDALVDRSQLIWTVGRVAGNFSNVNNFYCASGSLHQILLNAGSPVNSDFSCLQARLQEAILQLEDPRLHRGLCVAYDRLGQKLKKLRSGYSATKTPVATYERLHKLCSVVNFEYGTAAEVQRDLDRLRQSLQDLLCLKSRPNQHQLDRLRKDHPVLGLVHPDHMTTVNVIGWCQGWPGADDKMRKSVIACLGFGLLARKLTDSLLPGLLQKESPARWLLHFTRAIRQDSGKDVAWWDHEEGFSHLLPDLGSNDVAPMRNDEPEDAAPGVGDSQPEDSHRADPGNKGLTSDGVRSAPLKQKKAHPRGANVHRETTPSPRDEVGEQADTVPPSQSDRVSSPSQGAPGRSVPVSPHASEPTGQTEAPFAPSRAGALPPWSSSQIPSQSRPSLRGAEPQSPGSSVGRRAGQILVPGTQSQLEAGTSGQDTPQDERSITPNVDPRPQPPTGAVWAAEELRASAPFHCIGLGSLSPRFPHRLWGQKLSLGLRPIYDTAKLLGHSSRATVDALPEIMQERLLFRQEVVTTTYQALRSAYGREVAQSSLYPQIAALRDIFVGRVANILQQKFQCKDQSALGEAISMAVHDGLYDEDRPLVDIDLKHGKVTLNLEATIPKSEQDNDYDIEIPDFDIPFNSTGSSTALRFSQYFRPIWAPGRTEHECQTNVVTNLAAIHRVHTRPTRYQVPTATDEPPNAKSSARLPEVLALLLDPEIAWQAIGHLDWKRFHAPNVASTPGVHPMFSTGRIAPEGIQLSAVAEESNETTLRFRQALTQAQEHISQGWGSAVAQDWEEWNEWISNFNSGIEFLKTHDSEGNPIPVSSTFTSAPYLNLSEDPNDPIQEFTPQLAPRRDTSPHLNRSTLPQGQTEPSDEESVHTTDEEGERRATRYRLSGLMDQGASSTRKRRSRPSDEQAAQSNQWHRAPTDIGVPPSNQEANQMTTAHTSRKVKRRA